MGRRTILKQVSPLTTKPCDLVASSGISPVFPGLARARGQVPYALLTRSPLGCPLPPRRASTNLPARLACIRHAASVRPEPGSNSPSIVPHPCRADSRLYPGSPHRRGCRQSTASRPGLPLWPSLEDPHPVHQVPRCLVFKDQPAVILPPDLKYSTVFLRDQATKHCEFGSARRQDLPGLAALGQPSHISPSRPEECPVDILNIPAPASTGLPRQARAARRPRRPRGPGAPRAAAADPPPPPPRTPAEPGRG